MVQFGKHIDIFVETDNIGTGLFVVPYTDIKAYASANASAAQDEASARLIFETQWKNNLKDATVDFQAAVSKVWRDIFQVIASLEESRGAMPGVAIELYAEHAGTEATQELLVRFKKIRNVACNNSEALRKLVKKFDKHSSGEHLSSDLIPLVYASNFFIGQATLEEAITYLRALLDGANDALNGGHESESSNHNLLVQSRTKELDWLQRMTSSMEQDELSCLVAHRGFHSVHDHSHRRPIENSLQAYETAWTNGVHLCECDIALTLDDKIILAHDEDFSRLALDRNSPVSNKKVGDLTFKELISLPLTGFSRPPLLIDVLRSAHAIGDFAQLVVEIKPGNEAAARALANMLLDHPELVPCVAMIMSFDAYTIHQLRREFFQHPDANAAGLGGPRSSISSRASLMRSSAKWANPRASIRRPMVVGSVKSPLDVLGDTTSSLSLGEGNHETTVSSPTDSDIDSSKENTAVHPKLMLLTVSDPPKKPCELQVGVQNLSPVDGWMKSDEGSLDGVYLQFQQGMLEPEGLAALRELSRNYSVGVWTYSGIDPDDYSTFRALVQEGNVTFVNTDLPGGFRKGVSPPTVN